MEPDQHTPAYRAAVIGVGRAGGGNTPKGGGHQIGYTHGEMHSRAGRVRLAAAADISAENLAAFQERFAVEEGYTDHRAMLADARPEIVSICTYVGLHRQLIEDAARAGVKGIICEKPFLASPADIAAVQEVAAETGVKIVVCHIRRYRPAFRRARELYLSGEVGRPLMCLAGIEGWDLSEWGSHWLDMFRFLHGDVPVEWVMGQARVRDLRGYGHAMEDHAVAYFGFAGGGKALLDGGVGMAGPATMTLVGTEGTIRVLEEHTLVVDTAEARRTEAFKDPLSREWLPLWDHLLADLVQWIEGGPEPELGLTNMVKTSELNLAAYISALHGDRVDLPLDEALHEWPVELLARRGG
jgi:predicted dehydrogenase